MIFYHHFFMMSYGIRIPVAFNCFVLCGMFNRAGFGILERWVVWVRVVICVYTHVRKIATQHTTTQHRKRISDTPTGGFQYGHPTTIRAIRFTRINKCLNPVFDTARAQCAIPKGRCRRRHTTRTKQHCRHRDRRHAKRCQQTPVRQECTQICWCARRRLPTMPANNLDHADTNCGCDTNHCRRRRT